MKHLALAGLLAAIIAHNAWGLDVRCSLRVESRSGVVDFDRCPQDGEHWSCFEDVKERCTASKANPTSQRTYKHYTGVCASSLSECFKVSANATVEEDARFSPDKRRDQRRFEETWTCDEKILRKDFRAEPLSCIHSPGKFNCVEKIEERCQEHYAKNKTTRTFNKVAKACVTDINECL